MSTAQPRKAAAPTRTASATQPRRPAGVPTGGQFAARTLPAPGYTLDDAPVTIDGRPVEPEIKVFGDGSRIESYYHNGQLHDPDDGRPAHVSYRPDGTVELEAHCPNGRIHDPDDGRPAVVAYRPDGTVERETHWRNGRYQDPGDGRPAVVIYHPDGTVEREAHYPNGRLQDPDDGRPAVVIYHPDGTVAYEAHRQQEERRLRPGPEATVDAGGPPPSQKT